MNPSQYTDLYQRLGVDRTSTPQAIKSAFRTLAHQWHPDKRPSDPIAKQEFIAVSEAYEVLYDPQRRAVYDKTHFVDSFRARQKPQQAREYKERRKDSVRKDETFRFYHDRFNEANLEQIISNVSFGFGEMKSSINFDNLYGVNLNIREPTKKR